MANEETKETAHRSALPKWAQRVPVGVLQCDKGGQITAVNATLASMLGYAGPDALHGPLEGVFADVRDARRWRQALGEEPGAETVVDFLTQTGKRVPVRVVTSKETSAGHGDGPTIALVYPNRLSARMEDKVKAAFGAWTRSEKRHAPSTGSRAAESVEMPIATDPGRRRSRGASGGRLVDHDADLPVAAADLGIAITRTVWDESGLPHLVDANDVALRILGLRDLHDEGPTPFPPGAAIDSWWHEVTSGRRDRRPGARTFWHERPDGSRVLLDAAIRRSQFEGRPCMLTLFREVTDEHAVQEELHETRSLLEALSAHVPVALFLVEPSGRFSFVRGSTLGMFDVDAREMTGTYVQDYRERMPEICTAVEGAQMGQPGTALIRHEGKRFEAHVAPHERIRGQQRGVMGVIVDVSATVIAEQHRHEIAEHRAMLRRLREMNDFRSRLINRAAHDLNTPLTPIKIQLDLLAKSRLGTLTERQGRAIEVVVSNLRRLQTNLGRLVEAAQLENVAAPRGRAASRMDEWVERAIRLVRERGDDVTILEGQGCHDEVWVRAETGYMQLVIHELLDFATRRAGARGTVEVRIDQAPDEVCVRFLDDGAPFTEKDARCALEPPTETGTGDAAAEMDATVTTLSSARVMVEHMGGRVWATPSDRGGAEVGFAIPRALPSASAEDRRGHVR